MSAPAVICAAPDCENPVKRHPGRAGRPPIYCSKACRPSLAKEVLVVEVVQATTDDGQLLREWNVWLRRGLHRALVHRDLGPLSAESYAQELRHFFQGMVPARRSEER